MKDAEIYVLAVQTTYLVSVEILGGEKKHLTFMCLLMLCGKLAVKYKRIENNEV